MKTRALLLLTVLLLGAFSLSAADKKKNPDREEPGKRSVQGIVTDAGGQPIERAVVQLKNLKTLQVISFITLKDGMYRFRGLSATIDYEVKATHNGLSSQTRQISSFDNRPKAVYNLKVSK
jgi:hypothetical protein